ncbi:MAG: ribosome maturation factor RimM, partial [Tibeticola sp.]|nr:ribosome maturation factor RimM [Tibeticola sp.]
TVLVVAPKDPAQQRPPILIPFVSAFVDDVDLGQRVIAVDWQPDY